ncbi:MAG: ABC transporter ATP-binding protein [Cyanobacteriota bacterium]
MVMAREDGGLNAWPTAIDPILPHQHDQVLIQGLWHRYPGRGDWAVQNLDLALPRGELLGLLGPSGCGKTTLLRLIAGFERPDRGESAIAGRPVAGTGRWLPPERRGVGMVFQDYALFPHLDAWGNACFGLQRGDDRQRVSWLLELLGLAGLEHRYPHELSGGPRQRLALARALAPAPGLVLLDEPFSNLEVEVRLRLRGELPGVLNDCGAAGLIVTHDPEEALAICDRVAVMADGQLHQCAPPRELVERPATAFVGRFVLQANLVPARWHDQQALTPLGSLVAETGAATPDPQGNLEVLVTAEAIEAQPAADGESEVVGREFLGSDWLYQMQCGERRLRLRLPLAVDLRRGQRCHLRLRPGSSARLYPQGLSLRALG